MYIKVNCKLCKAVDMIGTFVQLNEISTEIIVLNSCDVCDFKPESSKRIHTEIEDNTWFTLPDGYKGFNLHPQKPTWGLQDINLKGKK